MHSTTTLQPPAPRPKQATFASFMGTDEPDERPQAKWNATLDGLTPSEIQAHIDQLYTSEVTSALRDIVHAYEIAMGVAVSRVSVRSMKTRWGSCTPRIRRRSHRTRTRRLPRRMPRHGCRPRARPLARAKPQSAVSRAARHVLPQQQGSVAAAQKTARQRDVLESVSARARSRHRSLPGEDRRAPKAYRA